MSYWENINGVQIGLKKNLKHFSIEFVNLTNVFPLLMHECFKVLSLCLFLYVRNI